MVFLSKRFNELNGADFIRMVEAGALRLKTNVDRVNALNVFPVPDGDTGTNMNLTLTSGVEELRRRPSEHLGKAAEALAKGLLMGARGNSGVILSQLFRGFSKAVADLSTANAQQVAAAFQNGVDIAYKAVVKPVEGTILTVAKEAAKQAVVTAKRQSDVTTVVSELLRQGQDALNRTPDLLPVLKQVGVVDSGGQGLVLIYEGFMSALEGQDEVVEPADMPYVAFGAVQPIDELLEPENTAVNVQAHAELKSAQAHLATEDIEYGYCTEFMIRLNPSKTASRPFDEALFREQLSAYGDSLLVVADDDLVKIHIHAEYPGTVMTHAQQYGELSRIKIENMRDQHTHILESEQPFGTVEPALQAAAAAVPAEADAIADTDDLKRYGFVAVSAGEGLSGIFTSLGVDRVLHGGQTMNPSTEDIVKAVSEVEAHTVFVLPNNSNIIMAAQQAVELVEDKQVIVVPSKSIPQGIAAIIAFQEEAAPDENADNMQQALQQVHAGQVTYAVRDTQMDGIDIKQGDYIGIHNSKIVASNPDLVASCRQLIDSLLADGAEILTLYAGADAEESTTQQLVAYVHEAHGDVEVEVHEGGQPLYYYIISAE
ncbi:DAK2 domain-containing protein [Paenibacillus validus]|uniref:DAK2 domain-containing protein n=1 Tax=Paenibacillus validus TaxID=44253 RepID=A0A7X3CW21_9BACL|nr:DAK2 domain-containing protein [Paenibacillus validus]MED4602905.1 DAK2 domain-containing protein [Paenibacillus validus]MED4609485.1 DAK2 domain-containing protein [Paenibacillus validus]MUG73689.1 DAK2 domain-containing protein [Paenibacillus validus]